MYWRAVIHTLTENKKKSESKADEEFGKRQANRLANLLSPLFFIDDIAVTPKLDTLQLLLSDRPTLFAPSSSLSTPDRDRPAPFRTLENVRKPHLLA